MGFLGTLQIRDLINDLVYDNTIEIHSLSASYMNYEILRNISVSKGLELHSKILICKEEKACLLFINTLIIGS